MSNAGRASQWYNINMADFSYESRRKNCGLYVQDDGCLAWEETVGYDPNSPWCRAIDEKIAAGDWAFLEACGIRPERFD